MKITSARFVKGITTDDDILHNSFRQIAFVGRSNVGKSSILTSLMDKKAVARAGKQAGKTVEINIFLVNEKYYFIDLPGYGYAQKGVAQREDIRAMIIGYLNNTSARPRTVALILDSKAGLTDFDRDMLDILSDNEHHVVVILNKADKLTQKEVSQKLAAIKNEIQGIEVLPYSSITERGKDLVLNKLIG